MAELLEKYKICPACGKKNYPGLVECIDCEQDLTTVRITDAETEKSETGSGKILVRLCDTCFSKNPPNARKCLVCGEDIADILPKEDVDTAPKLKKGSIPDAPTSPDAHEPCDGDDGDDGDGLTDREKPQTHEQLSLDLPPLTPKDSTEMLPEIPSDTPSEMPATVLNPALSALPYAVTLTTLDKRLSYTLIGERTVLGRNEALANYLSTKPYVSRVHCVLTVGKDGVFCEDLNNTNYTFVNNTRVIGRVKLENGDMLSLGGLVINGNRQSNAAYFTVTVA